MKIQIVRACLTLCVIAALTGCDEAGPDGMTPVNKNVFNSTFSDDAKLGSLSPADATRFCQQMNTWDLDREEAQEAAGCRLQGEVSARAALGGSDPVNEVGGPGATDADLKEACRQGYDQCVKGQILVVQPDCKKPNFTSGTCTATVAEAESCKNELAALYQKSLDHALECKDITAAKLQTPAEEPTLGAGCIAIATKCPTFLDFHFEGSAPFGDEAP